MSSRRNRARRARTSRRDSIDTTIALFLLAWRYKKIEDCFLVILNLLALNLLATAALLYLGLTKCLGIIN